MFINSTFENERYDFLSLFGREMFFHEGTNNRIEGWETPISVIFKHKNDIIIRFKKELKKYITYYNRYRIKTRLKMSPVQFREQYQNQL